MDLTKVTITGADDHTPVEELAALSLDYGYVEWGILARRSESFTRTTPRFPSVYWIQELFTAARIVNRLHPRHLPMQLSLHLCGDVLRSMLMGVWTLPEEYKTGFQRMQLNFHGEPIRCDVAAFHALLTLMPKVQFIFQVDGGQGSDLLEQLSDYSDRRGRSVDAVSLFDLSHGAGVSPDEWPKPVYMETADSYEPHGYAGGLGPHNLQQELQRISDAVGDRQCPVWVDMETHVRSGGDLDLELVKQALELTFPWSYPKWLEQKPVSPGTKRSCGERTYT